jgi:PilZ domain
MPAPNDDRRISPRTSLQQVVRIRPFDPELPPEYCTTVNISPDGLYFTTSAGHYTIGTNVYVTGDFQPGSPIHKALPGAIVRVDRLDGERFGIAIQILAGK